MGRERGHAQSAAGREAAQGTPLAWETCISSPPQPPPSAAGGKQGTARLSRDPRFSSSSSFSLARCLLAKVRSITLACPSCTASSAIFGAGEDPNSMPALRGGCKASSPPGCCCLAARPGWTGIRCGAGRGRDAQEVGANRHGFRVWFGGGLLCMLSWQKYAHSSLG